jgi:hypothetical protein
VTKGDDLRDPFGSVFWHDLSHATCSAETVCATGSPGDPVPSEGQQPRPSRQGTRDHHLRDGSPREVWADTYNAKLAVLVTGALKAGAITVAQIVAALNEDPDGGDPRVRVEAGAVRPGRL